MLLEHAAESHFSMTPSIDYGNLMHRALRGLIYEVLKRVERDGLPGEHHFFITFDTRHPDAQLADWLRERYPQDMTVVMQHWFGGLKVTDQGFAVILNFGEQPEPMFIPFDAIRTFVDPSVEFGLRFETHDSEDEDDDDDDAEEDAGAPPVQQEAEVVSLDKWRK